MFALTAHKYWGTLLQMKSCIGSLLRWPSVTFFLKKKTPLHKGGFISYSKLNGDLF